MGTGPRPRQPSSGKPLRAAALLLAGAGMEFAGVTAALSLLGHWLDGRWNTGPWLLLTGLAMGLTGGMYRLYRTGRRYFE